MESLQAQLSSVRGLLAISLVMMERRREREVLQLAATAVPGLVPCHTIGIHLDGSGWEPSLSAGRATQAAADLALAGCPASGGPVVLAGEAWAWALPLRSLDEFIGHLVVAGRAEPTPSELVLLRSLAQQTGVAVANARLHSSKEAANAALGETVTALERKTAIHDRFTQVAVNGGGHDGIVRALYELTGRAAGIEDRRGTLLAWAGPGVTASAVPTEPAAPPDGREDRDQLVDRALRAGRPIRSGGRLVTIARPRHDVVGVLFITDPDGSAGEEETVALEHGGTVLAIELARLLSLAETELRLGVDVVADLVSGSDVVGAIRRAEALGRDLSRPHRVVVIGASRARLEPDAMVHAVRGAVPGSQPPLLMQRGEAVVLLAEVRSADDRSFLQGLLAGLRSTPVGRSLNLGVGGVCLGPGDYPRSYREGRLALRIPEESGQRETAVVYDDLGVYQLLSEVSDLTGVDSFVRRWLGALLDYDARRGTDLVLSLSHYLDAGGRYDTAAETLAIGRSTLRYRLSRIRELSGHDLVDPDTRFQLHLATKAWFTRRALTGADPLAPADPGEAGVMSTGTGRNVVPTSASRQS